MKNCLKKGEKMQLETNSINKNKSENSMYIKEEFSSFESTDQNIREIIIVQNL